jgi:hypothetical protein
MTANEAEDWHAHMDTPVLFNHHTPVEVNGTEIQHVNLNDIDSTTDAVRNKERVLILTPLRDASKYIAAYFDLLAQLTYPHELIDLAFIVGDSTDDTMATLALELERVQNMQDTSFHSAMIVQKDFNIKLSQDVKYRHSFEAQGPRRKALGRARNYLLATALKPEHSWVYWRDVDIVEAPESIIEDFVAHDRDILVPNVWFHRYKKENGNMVDIEGRCKSQTREFAFPVLTNASQLTTTHGKNLQKVSISPPHYPRTSSSQKATSSSPPTANTWPSWATGTLTRTKKFLSTASAASTSWSKQTYTALASTSPAIHSRIKPRPKASRRWPNVLDTVSMVCQTMSSGISIPKSRRATW